MTTRRTGKKKATQTLVNGGTTPLVYTDEGHVLAAGERVEVEKIDDTARALVERGYLTLDNDDDSDSADQDEQDAPGESLPKSDS